MFRGKKRSIKETQKPAQRLNAQHSVHGVILFRVCAQDEALTVNCGFMF